MNCHLLSAKHYNQFWPQAEALFPSTPAFWSGTSPKSTEYLSLASVWEGIRLCQEQQFLPDFDTRGDNIFGANNSVRFLLMWWQLFFRVTAFASTLGCSCCQQLLDPCLNCSVKLTKVCIQTDAAQCTFAYIITSLLISYLSKVEGREVQRRNHHLCDQLNSVYAQ